MRSNNFRAAAVPACAILILELLWARPVAAQVQPTKEYLRELSRAGLVFDATVFRDFMPVRVLPNPNFAYSFAVRHRSLPLEVRFATRDLSTLPVPTGMDMTLLMSSDASASIMNMARKTPAGPEMTKRTPFDKGAVRQEFNADWGLTCVIVPDPTFAKYESGLVNIIYQEKRRSFGYMIYLFNGDFSGEIWNVFAQVFHAMRFKEPPSDPRP